jgi:CIC family chloride channel protein
MTSLHPRPSVFTRAANVVRGRWVAFTDWFNGLALSENAVVLGFAVAIGLLSALGVAAFYRSIDLAFRAFYRYPATVFPRIAFLAYRPFVTAIGFSVAFWIMKRLGQGHDGMNVPDVQLAVVRRGGELPTRPALARTVASAITIGSGGSAGTEGPVVVFAAWIGSWLGRTFRFAPARVTVLVGCATGAAISAAFNAPLAGAFFALEEIVGSLSGPSFAPVVVASVVAAVVSRGIFGNHPAFPIPAQFGYGHAVEVLAFFPLLGVVCGLVSALYISVYFAAADLEAKLRVPRAAIPLIGGMVVGVLVFASGGLLVGYGHLVINVSLFGKLAWYALASLALAKIVATALTLHFGGSGGVFTPSLYIGASTGGAVGVALSRLFPALALQPAAYGMVGMGAIVAGATDAPITGILLVFEMTNDYSIMLPLMITVVICHVIARRLQRDSLYSGWLRRRGESIEHGADRDVLAGLHVADAFKPAIDIILETAGVDEMLAILASSAQLYFPVASSSGQFSGMITAADLGNVAAQSPELRAVVVAADIVRPSETVTPADSLSLAIRKMGVRGAGGLPVLDRQTGRLIGMISRSDVLTLYEKHASSAPAEPIAVSA